MICAAPWKTCNCPWFNYNHLDENDRLNDMQVPRVYRTEEVAVVEVPREPPSPTPLARRSSTRMRQRERDRSLERADEALAAHLQAQLFLNATPSTSEGRRSAPNVQIYGVGNTGSHHMNDSYTVRPLATAAARTAAAAAPTSRPATRLFGRGSVRASPRSTRTVRAVTASTMAGLSRDGTRRGAGRVGTWLQHVELDFDAVDGRGESRTVEIDDWGNDGRSMVGVD